MKTVVLRPPGVNTGAESRQFIFDFSREPEFRATPPDSIASVVGVDILLDGSDQQVDPDSPPTAGVPVIASNGYQVGVEIAAGSADGNSYYVTCQVRLTLNSSATPKRVCRITVSSTSNR